ncbi:Adenine nucleotide alpha hydrolases-like superfamily protein [Striga hermonthica]|uniref:Adenine nucleotide alpha hydrolases-like superfamily protein n=1 Tax=Striga hermonthica TaxID=68872 RepID=A0A9N7NRJ0_STRHE|nr:Adenine nucleotide alpha hydrolases-like superfamily protein [Striga hermonthica]
MPSNLIIGSSIANSGDLPQLRAYYADQWENFTGGGTSEIEEEPAESAAVDRVLVSNRRELKIPLPAIREAAEEERPSAASIDFGAGGEDAVYVAVGRHGGSGGDEEASMGAVIWAIKNEAFGPSSVVFLVHVFPEAKFVPTPLGNLPINQVNEEQRELYLAKERGKRREFLNKFLNVCSASKVQVDTILIESEMEAKAILDLIPILNIRRLILGATKSTVRRMRSRKGNRVADQIRQGAPEYCEVKIICDGKEITELATGSTSSSTSPSPRSTRDSISSPKFGRGQEKMELDSASCGCFKL